MTDKEKQIEEMAYSDCKVRKNFTCYTSCKKCDLYPTCERRWFARDFYEAGYRKQSEVAENIIAMLKAAKPVVKAHFEAYDELIENIAAEYGVEVEQ